MDTISTVTQDLSQERYKAPFPWFGGKATVASLVWERLGDVPMYVEPFFGSGAVLLGRSHAPGIETVNDLDGLVSNFWRAVQADPEAVAQWADWPVNENDLHARHAWLVARKESLQGQLEGDPDFYDAKAAGWWVWGMSLWIGSEFCSGKGPWQVVEGEDGTRRLVHLSDAGRGVSRRRVHLSDAGRGVSRRRVHLGNAGQAGQGECGLYAWMEALAERFARVRVCCGDWRRVCGGNSGEALKHMVQQTPCGAFLDPPYSAEADRDGTIYRVEDLAVAHAVREWAIRRGEDARFRIALCGYEGEHVMPAGWECVQWKALGGYGQLAKGNGRGKANAHREVIWFSPHCLKGRSDMPLFDYVAEAGT